MILRLQGLRGIAILSVLLFHLWPQNFANGYIGVDIFFVLSGYLMAVLFSKQEKLTPSVILMFYYKRIFPLYFLILPIIYVVGEFVLHPVWIEPHNSHFLYSLQLLKNMETIWDGVDYFRSMSVIGLCRMRQTCSYIEKLVETNKMAFSCRKGLGIRLDVILKEKMLFFFHKKKCFDIISHSKANRMLSAIAVKVLRFLGHRPLRQNIFIVNFIKQIEFSCEIGVLKHIFSIFGREIADHIKCTSKIHFHPYTNSTIAFHNLNQVASRSIFCVNVGGEDYDTEEEEEDFKMRLFECTMNFLELNVSYRYLPKHFHRFLWDLMQSTTSFTLSYVNFYIYDERGKDFYLEPFLLHRDWPDYEILYKLTKGQIDAIEKLPKKVIKDIPFCIRQFELPSSKVAVICEKTHPGLFTLETIYIAENTDLAILEVLEKILKVTLNRKEFLDATEQRRKEMLKDRLDENLVAHNLLK